MKLFNFDCDPETKNMLVELARERDQSMSAVLRSLVRREHKALQLEQGIAPNVQSHPNPQVVPG